ncbi:MAG: hypothetical protein ACHQDD_01435 [Steroidobacterales bacterium]
MKRLFIAALLAGASAHAHALGRLADVSIIDRETGREIATHYYKGEYWIAGRPGARYAIAIRNHLGERVLAVTAVDGVNVISGDTASWDQTGYVFGPGESYQITGWRKSNAEVAAFEFTAAPGSYAARSGRAANVGVIGIAVFRERVPLPPPAESQAVEPPLAELHTTVPAAAAPESRAMDRARSPLAEKLGTGHGEREASSVVQTDFERLQSSPNELIRLRYDSVENLVAMGVIRAPSPLQPAPNPFPASPLARYVPDPP